MLHRQGCQIMQGFYFSRPLKVDALEVLLRSNDPFGLAERTHNLVAA